jgi:hypothetical protein
VQKLISFSFLLNKRILLPLLVSVLLLVGGEAEAAKYIRMARFQVCKNRKTLGNMKSGNMDG